VAGVDQTDSPRREQPEPSIAIDPQNTNIIAAGAQDFRRARELQAACGGDRWNGLYLSTNGGQTWSNELPRSPSPMRGCCAVAVTVLRAGVAAAVEVVVAEVPGIAWRDRTAAPSAYRSAGSD
jgi:hypothetical protein